MPGCCDCVWFLHMFLIKCVQLLSYEALLLLWSLLLLLKIIIIINMIISSSFNPSLQQARDPAERVSHIFQEDNCG